MIAIIHFSHPLYVSFLRHMVRTQEWDVNALLHCVDCPWRWQDEFGLFIAAHEDHANHVPTPAEIKEWERIQQEFDEPKQGEHGTLCPTCHGSGESKAWGSGLVCMTCRGTGGAY